MEDHTKDLGLRYFNIVLEVWEFVDELPLLHFPKDTVSHL